MGNTPPSHTMEVDHTLPDSDPPGYRLESTAQTELKLWGPWVRVSDSLELRLTIDRIMWEPEPMVLTSGKNIQRRFVHPRNGGAELHLDDGTMIMVYPTRTRYNLTKGRWRNRGEMVKDVEIRRYQKI